MMKWLAVFLFAAPAVAAQTPAALAGHYRHGQFEAYFDSAGRHRFLSGGAVGNEGRFELRGDTLILFDEAGPLACPETPGRYRVSRRADTLWLAILSDECVLQRPGVSGAWVRDHSGEFAIANVTVIDGTGAAPREHQTIVIKDGRIAEVFTTGSRALPSYLAVLDLSGRWAIPGLIDAHVHLATDPSEADRRPEVERRLRRALYGGITVVRDMAGDARVLDDLARAARVGDIDAPAIYYSAIMAGREFLQDPRVRSSTRGAPVGKTPWVQAVDAQTNWQIAVAQARGTGATGIKLYAALDAAVLPPLVREAHRQGMRVWAHATLFPAKPSELVRAGVDVLSHASLLAWEGCDSLPSYRERARIAGLGVRPDDPRIIRVLAAMAAHGTALDPTLWVMRDDTIRLAWSALVTKRAFAEGVPIVAGTDDMGNSAGGSMPNLHRELEFLVRYAGLTPTAAIVAATRNAARALGIEDTHGTIAEGKVADLVILDSDPIADIRNTRDILHVIREGRLYTPPR